MKPTQKEQSGQSLVELAISLMIILMLLLGAVEISLTLFQYVTIRDAAQEGAVYGSIHPTVAEEADIKRRAIDAAGDVVQISAADVTVTSSGARCEGVDGSNNPNTITITIIYDHHITFPLVAPMLGTDTTTLTAKVTNTILQPKC